MFTIGVSPIITPYKKQQATCPLTDKWIKKMDTHCGLLAYMYKVSLSEAGTLAACRPWNMGDIVLSEISQDQKD